MSQKILEQLENKVQQAIEMIELLRMQIEELEEKNSSLLSENATLKNRQAQWELSLSSLLNKLEGVAVDSKKPETRKMKQFVGEEEQAYV